MYRLFINQKNNQYLHTRLQEIPNFISMFKPLKKQFITQTQILNEIFLKYVIILAQAKIKVRINCQNLFNNSYRLYQLLFYRRVYSIQNMRGVISIEGNLGAGKSTLLSLLEVSVIKEPVDQWTNTAGSNILERYYSDPKRWSFTFQLNALHSRTLLWNQTLKQEPQKRHFSQRSPMADRFIFGEIMKNQGNMDASEFNIYSSICESLMVNCPLEAIIYLKCDPQICHERIKKRNRQGQQGIPIQYLQKVHDRHEEWISRQKNVKILVVDTGVYDVENPQQLGQLITLIKQFIAQLN